MTTPLVACSIAMALVTDIGLPFTQCVTVILLTPTALAMAAWHPNIAMALLMASLDMGISKTPFYRVVNRRLLLGVAISWDCMGMSQESRNIDIAHRLQQAFDEKQRKMRDAGTPYNKVIFANTVGESKQAVQAWFRTGTIDKLKLSKVSKELDVPIEWILTGDDKDIYLKVPNRQTQSLVKLIEMLPSELKEKCIREIFDSERLRVEQMDDILKHINML